MNFPVASERGVFPYERTLPLRHRSNVGYRYVLPFSILCSLSMYCTQEDSSKQRVLNEFYYFRGKNSFILKSIQLPIDLENCRYGIFSSKTGGWRDALAVIKSFGRAHGRTLNTIYLAREFLRFRLVWCGKKTAGMNPAYLPSKLVKRQLSLFSGFELWTVMKKLISELKIVQT